VIHKGQFICLPLAECAICPISESIRNASKFKLSRHHCKDYQAYEYLCYDRFYFPGTSPRKRSNLININGHYINLSDSLFALLLRFVGRLKRSKNGWVNRGDLIEDGLVTDWESFQVFNNLRVAITGSLLEKNGQKIIQNDGSKNYRLSTHPDFITYDKTRLLKHPSLNVRSIVKKLPKSTQF